MKRISTFFAGLLLSISLWAQPDEIAGRIGYTRGMLSINMPNDNPVLILIDGSNYGSMNNGRDFFIKELRAGYHTVKIIRKKNYRSGYGNWNQNSRPVLYEGNIYLKPQFHVDISINRFGRALIDERRLNEYDEDEFNINETGTGGYNNIDGYLQCMDDRKFEQFIETLRKESFDNTRLILAKQTIAANNFSSGQAKQIVQSFSFDNNKLDAAKYCYKYTIDKKNYFMVNDAFSFSSSKEELSRYVQDYR